MRIILSLIFLLAGGCSSDQAGEQPGSGAGAISRTMEISVQTDWRNTEIYLQPGDQVKLSASGSWSLEDGKALYGPEGSMATYQNCRYGELVAQIGLHYYGRAICVGEGTVFTADAAGLLYLSSWAPWHTDRSLGEGSVTVLIEAEGVEAPTLAAAAIGGYDLQTLAAEELEIAGEHVILTVSRAQLSEFQQDAGGSLDAFENFYQSHLSLAGAAPYNGHPIRYFPDADTRKLGPSAWMLSGNPIRVDPIAAYGGGFDGSNLLQSQNMANSVWGFVHEMGHDFTFINGGRYLIGGGPTEAWANIFTLYTLENLGYPEADQDHKCDDLPDFFLNGDYQTFKGDTWLPLCMFFELKEVYGWRLFRDFFHDYNTMDRQTAPGKFAEDYIRWAWLTDEFTRLAGADVSAVFLKYHVPLAPASP